MGRSAGCSCCIKEELNRGPWTPEEDNVLREYIRKHGDRGNWRKVPKLAGLMRCGKSCRLRWLNYLRPDLKRGCFSEDEADLIIKLHSLLGNRWSLIAGRLPGRSDNEVKNFWNFHLSKKLLNMGINPKTHKPLVPMESSQATAATARLSLPKVSSHSNPTAKELHQQKSFDQAEPELVWLDQDEDYKVAAAAEDTTNEILSNKTMPTPATTTATATNTIFCYDWNNSISSSSCSSSGAGSPSSMNWSSNSSPSSFESDLWTFLLEGEGGQVQAQDPSDLKLDGLVEFLDAVAWPQEAPRCP